MAIYISPKFWGDVPPIVGFDQQLSPEHIDEICRKLVRQHLDQLSESGWSGCGQIISDVVRAGSLGDLCTLDPELSGYGASDQYHIRQCLAFFQKRADIDIGVEKERVAWKKFQESEVQCQLTNRVMLAHSQGLFQFHPDVEHVLYRAQQKICDLLADAYPEGAPTWDQIKPRFGPGASTQTPKKNACPVTKLSGVPACAANTVHVAEELLSLTGWATEDPRVLEVPVMESELQFVPKNAKTFRAICVEPQLNSMYQNGLGDILAEILRLVGLDTRDQSKNQRAALYGSISGRTATIDLSSASDSIALGLVYWLFPMDWAELFFTLSCRQTRYRGKLIDLHKISSMGNGFTFPLETMIFWALTAACVEVARVPRGQPRVLVYGDDIICPVETVPLLRRVFSAVGFTINHQKSFWDGSFRESCGKDYVEGNDIRPFFLSDDPETAIAEFLRKRREKANRQKTAKVSPRFVEGRAFFALHNYYVRRGMFSFAVIVEKLLHPSIRLRGPDGYGEGHLVSPIYISRPNHKRGMCGFKFDTWGFSPKKLRQELFERFFDRRKTQRRSGKHVWEKRQAGLAFRVATYTIYCRETEEDDRLNFLSGIRREDSDIVVTPGRGPLRRMSLYIFEPALLQKS